MKVTDFQNIYYQNISIDDEIEVTANCICELFNKPYDEVNRFTPKQFIKWSKKATNKLRTSKQWYQFEKVKTNANDITFGEFIEVLEWQKKGFIESIHLTAASLLLKKTKHSTDVKRILNSDVTQYYDDLIVFMDSFYKLLKSYKGLFDTEAEDIDANKSGHPFQNKYGWMFSAKMVAELEGVNINNAYQLPIIQALNDLSYLKSKQSFDKWLNKV